ncbi:hypothetical protein ABD76_21650 [Paenibacillus dendritiformis]|uniref:hypothetical protein n=1 Tax=Paenibacillus dendritiformis TaxID=130049 RepID=UPI0018CED943|nr:hypothetical protein [Paenibacillus dendritiformis]MBG9794933.1 hypothetical protein [Paenibacillus dendritiformis]
MTRLGQKFLEQEGLRLGDYVEMEKEALDLAGGMLTFYHYTHADRVDSIFSPGGGLHAQRPVACLQVPAAIKIVIWWKAFFSRFRSGSRIALITAIKATN